MGSWLTIIVGGLLTVVPQLVAAVPSPYKDIASASLAAAVAAWHLYQPSPSQAQNK
jgi:hypothetical protein